MVVSLTHTTVAVGTDAGNGEIRKNQWHQLPLLLQLHQCYRLVLWDQ